MVLAFTNSRLNLESVMDKDRVAGSAKQAAGAVKQGIRKGTGDQN